MSYFLSCEMRPLCAILMLVLVGGASSVAKAADSSESARELARDLGREGVDAYKRGEYGLAIDKLEHACRILQAPTLALWWARALRQESKLIEAAEKYREAMQLEVTTGKQEIQRRAQEQAARERLEVLVEIPSLIFVIEGTDIEHVELEVDGVPVPKSQRSRPWRVDPGNHSTHASANGHSREVTTRLMPGEQRIVRIELGEANSDSTPTASSSASAKPSKKPIETPRTIRTNSTKPSSSLKTAGWIMLGAGGLGLAASGVTALIARSKLRTLNDNCPSLSCPATERDTLDEYRNLRLAYRLSLVVGVAGIAGGGWAYLAGSRWAGSSEKSARTEVRIGLDRVEISGAF